MKIFKVENPVKLSKLLFDNYGAELSYSTYQKLLRNKDIKIDGKRTNKDLLLSVGQTVAVYYDGKGLELTPLFDSNGVLVFYKPPTITSEDFAKKVSESFLGFELCHRLDRNTAGLLVFAKGKSFEEMLKAFKERTVDKFYLAEVYGSVKNDSEILTAYLKKDEERAEVKIFDQKVDGSDKIITEYEVVERRAETTLLKVKLITGKTHQIRAHLAHIGHFIVGDQKYGDSEINKKLKVKRQKLIAFELIFNFDKNSPLYNIDKKKVTLKNVEI